MYQYGEQTENDAILDLRRNLRWIRKLSLLPRAGFVSYCEDEGIIVSYGGGGAGGWGYTTYSKINNGAIEDIDTFGINAGTTPSTYTRNGETISESEYNSGLQEYRSKNWTTVGRENYFDDLYCKVGDIYYDYFFDHYMAWFVSTESTATTVTIPEKVNGLPVTIISSVFLNDNSTIKTLNLPASIDSFYYHGLSGENLTAINVDSSNPYYASKDGVMYNKDMTELIKFPTAKDSASFTFPKSVTKIGRYAFAWCTGTKSIVIPNTIDTINDYAFYSCPNLSSITIKHPECDIYDDEDKGITICNTSDSTTGKGNYLGVIRGYDDSTAQKYADNFGRTFISLGSSVKEGDCNNDGYVNIADAVMLQRYLLGNGSLTNWKNADLCKDNRIDTFDMVLMRKLLIPPQTQLKGIYAEGETVDGFYFSHDPRPFNIGHVENLTIVTLDENGKKTESMIDPNRITLKGIADNPMDEFSEDNASFAYQIYVYFDGSMLTYQNGDPVKFNAYIGKKGDVNCDNVVNPMDSSYLQNYYKALCNGESPSLICSPMLPKDNVDYENFVAFLADVECDIYTYDNWKTKKSDRIINGTDVAIIENYYACLQTTNSCQEAWDMCIPGRHELMSSLLTEQEMDKVYK